MEYDRVQQIYTQLNPKPQSLVKEGRFFVREGYLRMWKDDKQKYKKRYLFLFNDLILICKKESKLSSNKKFWLRIQVSLRSGHAGVEDVKSHNNDFLLHVKRRSFRFQCDSENLKNNWMEDLTKACAHEHDENMEVTTKKRDEFIGESNKKVESSSESYEDNFKQHQTQNDDSDDFSQPFVAPSGGNPFTPQSGGNPFGTGNTGGNTGGNPFGTGNTGGNTGGNPFGTGNTGGGNPFATGNTGGGYNPFLQDNQQNTNQPSYNPFLQDLTEPHNTSTNYNPFLS